MVLYESQEPLRNGEHWIAWLKIDLSRLTASGPTKLNLPFCQSVFFGASKEGASNRAITFWHDKNAKNAARKEQGRRLALSKAAA